MWNVRVIGGLAVGVLMCSVAACGDDGAATPVIDPGDGGNYAPAIDPAKFVAGIDNPYFPLKPGAHWVYQGSDGEKIDVTVTTDQRTVMGIPAVVVRDTATLDGEVVEDTVDWFGQDVDGNVWYLGEDTKEYENGKVVSTAGTWEAGVDGAVPGIVMPATPTAGSAYRQEYYRGEAEDMAEVLRVGQTTTVAGQEYRDVLVTREWSPLEPKAIEEKYYAPGVGMVLAVKVAGGEGREELVLHDG